VVYVRGGASYLLPFQVEAWEPRSDGVVEPRGLREGIVRPYDRLVFAVYASNGTRVDLYVGGRLEEGFEAVGRVERRAIEVEGLRIDLDEYGFAAPGLYVNLSGKIVFPYIAQEVDLIHSLGLPAVFHCDGNVTPLIGYVIKSGFDGIQSLQPNAGVDIISIKREWGDKICLMGNLDLDYLLPLGTPKEVEDEVKRLIRNVAPGGGYILSTTNVLTRYVPPENALVMYKAAEKYGKYPIRA
ncbi:MAG: uroporphyrinogen decarboxylase family protein, partial [Candidatus Bathyarchaeia archaeon]